MSTSSLGFLRQQYSYKLLKLFRLQLTIPAAGLWYRNGMDSSLASAILTYGPLGIFVVLFILGIIVPKWVVTKMQTELNLKEEALKTERLISSQATAQLAIANQLIGELRNIALSRAPESVQGAVAQIDPPRGPV
jgi:hypothetical protein